VYDSNIKILLINSVEPKNAGTYSCLSTGDKDSLVQGHAILSVIGELKLF